MHSEHLRCDSVHSHGLGGRRRWVATSFHYRLYMLLLRMYNLSICRGTSNYVFQLLHYIFVTIFPFYSICDSFKENSYTDFRQAIKIL